MTIVFNVPMNDALETVDPEGADATTAWARSIEVDGLEPRTNGRRPSGGGNLHPGALSARGSRPLHGGGCSALARSLPFY